jgi:hemerythrin-like domain-containing protein
MKPTEILMAEHRVIEQVLACLEKMAAQAVATGQVDRAPALQALEFFRMFADKCHHGKEEAQLFPLMEARGFPRHGGPTGVMLHEHEQGRACVRAMAAAIEQQAATEFAAQARQFIALLSQHIQKEDHCLFAMADQRFTAADQATLLAQFEKVEHEEMGAGTHEKFLGIAADLARQYDVAPVVAGHHSCGHH